MGTVPQKGDRVTVEWVTGYKLVQERPFACRDAGKCVCGKGCYGTWHKCDGTVEEVIYYADNSIEGYVLCDDGVRRLQRYVAPHGDLCF